MEKNRLVDQLKKHIEEVGEEAFKQEVFEFNCEYYGIDSKSENAKMKLQIKQWWEMFKYNQLPKIRIGFDFIITLLWMFLLGIHLVKNRLVWIFVSALWAVYFGIRTWNHLFKKDLEDTFKEEHENRKIAKDTEISQTLNKLRIELVKYISDIYQTIDDADIDGYMGFVLYGFVRKFMGECDARFTIRQLDLETNKMYTVFTTKGELKPGDINIKKNNK